MGSAQIAESAEIAGRGRGWGRFHIGFIQGFSCVVRLFSAQVRGFSLFYLVDLLGVLELAQELLEFLLAHVLYLVDVI